MMAFVRRLPFFTVIAICLLGFRPASGQAPGGNIVPVTVKTLPLSQPSKACTDHFVAHELDHVTTVPNPKKIRMYEGNGEGVAINDLDGDGRLDIALANYSGPNTILWNEGNLKFTTDH